MNKKILFFSIAALCLFTAVASYAQSKDSSQALTIRPVERHSETEPKMLKNLSQFIVYPEEAMKKGLEGNVYLSALIGKDGMVEKINVDRFTDSVFIKPAVNALKQMTFSPATQHGEPVRAWWTLPISFKLGKKQHPKE